jgi:hypothetical protein
MRIPKGNVDQTSKTIIIIIKPELGGQTLKMKVYNFYIMLEVNRKIRTDDLSKIEANK